MDNKNSIKKEMNILKHILMMIFELKKSMYILIFIHSVLSAITPFINLILSAAILDELLGSQRVKILIIIVMILVGTNFISKMLLTTIEKYRDIANDELNSKYLMKVSKKSMGLDYEYIESKETIDLIRKMEKSIEINGGLKTVVYYISTSLKNIIEIVLSISIFSTILTISNVPNLAAKYRIIQTPIPIIAILILILINTVVNIIFGKKMSEMMRIRFEELSKIGAQYNYLHFNFLTNYEAGKDIRIYNVKQLLTKRNNDLLSHSIEKLTQIFFKDSLKYNIIISIFNSILLGSAYLFVVLKAFIRAITIGSILKQVGVIRKFYTGVLSLIENINELRVNIMFFESSFSYFELPDIKIKGDLHIKRRNDNSYNIEFKNVSFKYPNSEDYAIKNISLMLLPKERLAIVGMNGSGKTTMIKLLCRLYEPTKGEILLDGINIKKYDIQEYRRLFSAVFQDFQLFSFKVDENIASGCDINRNLLDKSMQNAGLYERIQQIVTKENTYINKNFDVSGFDFSGGERQKIAISRALYKDASFIILDEPTAALDPISEFEIYYRFDALIGNKTAIYISHRLASCRFCHVVVVFHEGRIIQKGSHEELLKDKKNIYYEMWNAQAQYYTNDSHG